MSETHRRNLIMLVDQQVLFRQAVASLLDGQPDFQVVAQASSLADAVALAREHRPDLVLTDYYLSDATGIDASLQILAVRPQTKVVFLGIADDDECIFHAIRAGARGCLPKNISVTELLNHLRGVVRGEAALTPSLAARLLDAFARQRDCRDAVQTPSPITRGGTATLTLRELAVLEEIRRGASNREIARHLVISENTVKHHVGNILDKLHARNRQELLRGLDLGVTSDSMSPLQSF